MPPVVFANIEFEAKDIEKEAEAKPEKAMRARRAVPEVKAQAVRRMQRAAPERVVDGKSERSPRRLSEGKELPASHPARVLGRTAIVRQIERSPIVENPAEVTRRFGGMSLRMHEYADRPASEKIADAGARLAQARVSSDSPAYLAHALAARTNGFKNLTARAIAEVVDDYAEAHGHATTYDNVPMLRPPNPAKAIGNYLELFDPTLYMNPARYLNKFWNPFSVARQVADATGGLALHTIPNVWAPLENNPVYTGALPAPHTFAAIPKDAEPLQALARSLQSQLSAPQAKALFQAITKAVASPIDAREPDGDRTRRWFMFWWTSFYLDPAGAKKGEAQHWHQVIFQSFRHNSDHFADSVKEFWKGRPLDSIFALNNGDPANIEDH